MFAFDYLSGNPQLNSSALPFTISAYTDNIVRGQAVNRTNTIQNITLEKCTINHFSILQGIEHKFSLWNATNWLCLPLNQNYDLEGSWSLNGNYQSINILFECSGVCQALSQGINIDFFTLSPIVNP